MSDMNEPAVTAPEPPAPEPNRADIAWIFANGPDVLAQQYRESVETLATALGVQDKLVLGYGIDFLRFTIVTLELAKPFLLTGDRVGWAGAAAALRLAYQNTQTARKLAGVPKAMQ